MKLTLEKAKEMMERNGGSLYLRDTQISRNAAEFFGEA